MRPCSKVSPRMCRRSKPINAQINQINSRVLPIVEAASGQKLGAEPEKWKGWWTDQLGYAFQASQPAIKPTFTDFVDASSWSASLECFGRGTLVHAAGGPRAIETIQIGDRVLTQNTSTGVLSYQPVMAVHRTRTAATFRIDRRRRDRSSRRESIASGKPARGGRWPAI